MPSVRPETVGGSVVLRHAIDKAALSGQSTRRALVRAMARHYERRRDLPAALAGNVRPYEIDDIACRWLTAGILHRLCRTLKLELRRTGTRPGDPRVLLLRKCLRGEAAIYLRQTAERGALEQARVA